MTCNLSMVGEEELSEIVEAVWMSVLELPIKSGVPADLLATEYLTASILISGAWEGVVNVRSSLDILSTAAAHMFTININDIEKQDCIDTLTELTNMFGCTLKCMLLETYDLNLPVIVARADEMDVHD